MMPPLLPSMHVDPTAVTAHLYEAHKVPCPATERHLPGSADKLTSTCKLQRPSHQHYSACCPCEQRDKGPTLCECNRMVP